jgi:peptide/nickel transport system ATP-binding protein
VAVDGVTKDFKSGRTLRNRRGQMTRAIDDVTLSINRGEVLGLVGESGSGKTTLGLSILKLLEVDSGAIRFKGADITHLRRAQLADFRKQTQMIFQDPYESLNPFITVYSSVSAGLNVFRKDMNGEEKVNLVSSTLEALDLSPAEDFLYKFPGQLSGGQRQRVVIARAVIMSPSFIVADEAVSMLDVSIRAGILNKLISLKENTDLSMLFITHDIAVARYISDRLAVMHLGQIAEYGDSEDVISNPLHPYTQILINAVPVADVLEEQKPIPFTKGDWEKVNRGYRGCSFADRCPFVMQICRQKKPPMIEQRTGHTVACFLYPK